ncbi:MAG: Cu(I)-responsive transcriptional regulator [Pseudomonadota bacterium]
MNISDAAKATGLPPKTIRYYEDIGLVTPGRSPNGYRDFSDQDIHRLAFLARARALGFPVADCRDLLALYSDQARASAEVKAIAQTHLDAITDKIDALNSLRATLSDLVASCAGDNRPDCPILHDLASRV